MKYKELLVPYNPWWEPTIEAFKTLPDFQRPIFNEIYKGLKEIPQIISITGPRRVGKSTLIKQIIKNLIKENIDSQDIAYYSMDDPALLRSGVNHDSFFDSLMEMARKKTKNQPLYIFLDEIQRFERWELFLKKYYDLHYPIKFLVSGSASSPIFKKSRESLLGRIKDYHLLPFSFREFLLYHERNDSAVVSQLDRIYQTGKAVMGMFTENLEYVDVESVKISPIPNEIRLRIDKYLEKYLLEGGFPEVWTLPDWATKQSYLFDNQVEKVISEDLVLAVELRKPEMLKRFYVSLLEHPGRELNFQQLAKEMGVNRASIEKYFPLLEMTDMTRRVEKFSKNPVKVRRGNIKCYLVDLALRNAVLRIQENLLKDDQILGLYAENLVFNALKKWEGTMNISYFRQKNSEIDFIIHVGAKRYLPFEVKYKNHIGDREFGIIKKFCEKYKCSVGLIITKRWDDFYQKERLFYMPLAQFLLLFD